MYRNGHLCWEGLELDYMRQGCLDLSLSLMQFLVLGIPCLPKFTSYFLVLKPGLLYDKY